MLSGIQYFVWGNGRKGNQLPANYKEIKVTFEDIYDSQIFFREENMKGDTISYFVGIESFYNSVAESYNLKYNLRYPNLSFNYVIPEILPITSAEAQITSIKIKLPLISKDYPYQYPEEILIGNKKLLVFRPNINVTNGDYFTISITNPEGLYYEDNSRVTTHNCTKDITIKFPGVS